MYLSEEQIISEKQINLEERKFCFSFFQKEEAFISSLEKCGVMHPLLVKKQATNYVIVSGWKRFFSARIAGISKLPVKEISDRTSDKDVFLAVVEENMVSRGLHFIEKAMVLHKCKTIFLMKPEQIIRDVMPCLALSPHLKVLNDYLFVSQINESLKKQIFEKNVPIECLLPFKLFEVEWADALIGIMLELRMGVNKIKESVTLIDEILKRENISSACFLKQIEQFFHSLEHVQTNKGECFRTWLRERRFPRHTDREKKISDSIKELKLPKKIELKYPASFEGNRFTLSISFEDFLSLAQVTEGLQEKIKNEASWQRFFSWFSL